MPLIERPSPTGPRRTRIALCLCLLLALLFYPSWPALDPPFLGLRRPFWAAVRRSDYCRRARVPGASADTLSASPGTCEPPRSIGPALSSAAACCHRCAEWSDCLAYTWADNALVNACCMYRDRNAPALADALPPAPAHTPSVFAGPAGADEVLPGIPRFTLAERGGAAEGGARVGLINGVVPALALPRLLTDLPRLPTGAASVSSTIVGGARGFRVFVHPLDIDQSVSKAIVKDGAWEGDLLKHIVDRLRQVPERRGVFLDVGANLGFHSVAVAAAGYRVMSVEPVPRNVDLLTRSIVANGFQRRVKVYATAVTDEYPRGDEGGAGGAGGAVPLGGDGGRTACMHSQKHNQGHSFIDGVSNEVDAGTPCQEVPLHTLDETIGLRGDILTMKIDIEGYEYHALKGFRRLLARAPPCFVFMEVVPSLLNVKSDHQDRDLLLYLERVAGYDIYSNSGNFLWRFKQVDAEKIKELPWLVQGHWLVNLYLEQRDLTKCIDRVHTWGGVEGPEVDSGLFN